MVGLGQAEAADDLALGEARQVGVALLVGAELVDRRHHQRGLHAHHRAVGGIDPLDLARDEAVARELTPAQPWPWIVAPSRPSAPISRRIAALHELVPVGLADPRHQPLLGVAARGLLDQPLVLGELLVDAERIVPGELGPRRLGDRGGGFRLQGRRHRLFSRARNRLAART